MADQTRHDVNGHKNTSEPPRLHIAHHQPPQRSHRARPPRPQDYDLLV
jgi:hypothetical protein